jgi:hypothetical protein
MTTRFASLLIALSALLLLGLAGCSDEQSAPTSGEPIAVDDYQTLDLDAPQGGLTRTDEEPAFGDPYLEQATARADAETHEDDLADDAQVQQWLRMGEQAGDPDHPGRPRFTFLRLVWGSLEAMPDSLTGRIEDGDLVDWSGRLSVDRGVVLVRRVIRFERPWDSIVRPRPDRQTVAWHSHTGGHLDGLLVQIIEPPRDQDGDGEVDPGRTEPNRLHLETAEFARTFELAALPGLDTVYPADTEGEAIHLTGFQLGQLGGCPAGFLAGVWRDDPASDDGRGFFRGRWVGLTGRTAGHVLGVHGVNEAGERVFFGKYVSRSGRFRGLLQGTWEPAAEDPGAGRFGGVWRDADDVVVGRLGGRYLDRPERPGGFFQGRWATLCDEESSEQIAP